MIFKDIWECIKLSWAEWHMIVSGWGDGAALNKGERIPSLEEISKDRTRDDDFYAILAREAWYYKFGLALGRLTWAIIGAAVIVRVLG